MAKKKVICDTDVLIDYWDVSQKRHAKTKSVLESDIGLDNIVLSAMTKMELLFGATNKTDMGKLNSKLRRFNIALLNNQISIKSFELMEAYKLSHGLSIPDCFIASTALITKLELFTYNTKDFKFISDIKLFKFS